MTLCRAAAERVNPADPGGRAGMWRRSVGHTFGEQVGDAAADGDSAGGEGD